MPDVKPIPDNYPRVIPYLHIDGAADAIAFYEDILGAKMRGPAMEAPDGKIGHAELELGDSLIMLSDESPDFGALAPGTVGGTPVTIHAYVEDVDSVFSKALEKGAKERSPLEDQFYGDRSGSFEDPWGHVWNVASHVEDVPPEEMAKRAEEAMGG